MAVNGIHGSHLYLHRFLQFAVALRADAAGCYAVSLHSSQNMKPQTGDEAELYAGVNLLRIVAAWVDAVTAGGIGKCRAVVIHRVSIRQARVPAGAS